MFSPVFFSDFDIRQESICQIEIFPVLCPSLSGEGCHHLAIAEGDIELLRAVNSYRFFCPDSFPEGKLSIVFKFFLILYIKHCCRFRIG